MRIATTSPTSKNRALNLQVKPNTIPRLMFKYIMTAFWLSSLIVPVSPLNKILFCTLLFLAVIYTPQGLFCRKKDTISPFIVFFVFGYGFLQGQFIRSDPDLRQQFFLGSSVLFLIYPIQTFQLDLNRLARISGIAVAGATLGMLTLLFTLGPSFTDTSIWKIFLTYSHGVSGERGFGDDPFLMFHLGSAPFLFLPFTLFAHDLVTRPKLSSLLSLLLITMAVLASTSRGLVAVCLLALLAIILLKSKGWFRIWTLSAATICLAAMATWALLSTDMLNPQETSNSMKIGHLASYLDGTSCFDLITGKGLASYYFSQGYGTFIAHTEITPFDMIRYFGIPFAVLIFAALAWPATGTNSYRGKILTVVLFMLYLLLSLTNPVLFNSAGLLVVLWYWNAILSPSPNTEVHQ